MNVERMLDVIASADADRLQRFDAWARTQDQQQIALLLWAVAYRRAELVMETQRKSN